MNKRYINFFYTFFLKNRLSLLSLYNMHMSHHNQWNKPHNFFLRKFKLDSFLQISNLDIWCLNFLWSIVIVLIYDVLITQMSKVSEKFLGKNHICFFPPVWQLCKIASRVSLTSYMFWMRSPQSVQLFLYQAWFFFPIR